MQDNGRAGFVRAEYSRLKIGIEMLTVQRGRVATGRSGVSVWIRRVGKGQWSRRLGHRVVLGSKDPPRRLSCVSCHGRLQRSSPSLNLAEDASRSVWVPGSLPLGLSVWVCVPRQGLDTITDDAGQSSLGPDGLLAYSFLWSWETE